MGNDGTTIESPRPASNSVLGAPIAWLAALLMLGMNAMPDAISVHALVETIESLPPGITELGCHPAAEVDHPSAYADERIQELEALCDPSVLAAIDRCGIALGSFSELTHRWAPR